MRSSFAPGCEKKFFEVGPKKEECEKGVGAKRVGAKQFRNWVRKKIFRALCARTHFFKILEIHPKMLLPIELGLIGVGFSLFFESQHRQDPLRKLKVIN